MRFLSARILLCLTTLALGCSSASNGPGGTGGAGGGSSGTGLDASATATSASGSGSGVTSASGGVGSNSSNSSSNQGTGSSAGGAGSTTSSTGTGANPNAPGDVKDLLALPANQSSYVSWVPPGDADYAGVLVLRRAGAPVTDVPVTGTTYAIGDAIGASTVAFTADGTNVLDTQLTNGTTYHYRAFAFDTDHNYSLGIDATARPRNPQPTSYTDSTIGDLDGPIGDFDLTLDAQDQAHVGIVTNQSYDYATCTGGCDQSSDWTITHLGPEQSSARSAPTAVDAQGHPRIAYSNGSNTIFRACDSGCTAEANWSTTALVGAGNAPGAMLRDSAGAYWIAGGGSSLFLSHCANGCSSAANWTTVALPWATSSVSDLEIGPQGQLVILTYAYMNVFQLRHSSCTSNCFDAAFWTSNVLTTTQGSIPPANFRFTADGLGALEFYSPFNSSFVLGACDSCAPSSPSSIHTFPTNEVYNGGGLERSAQNQPRVFAEISTGAFVFDTCDYRCDLDSNWVVGNLTPATAGWAKMRLRSDELPTAVYSEYGTNGINRLFMRKPNP